MVKCGSCHKQFVSLSLLKLHLPVHGGSRFVCGEDDCGRVFHLPRVFFRHLRKSHQSEGNVVRNAVIEDKTEVNENFEYYSVSDNDFCNDAEDEVQIPDLTVDAFKDKYESSVDVLVAKLYENPSIPRNFVQTLIEDFDLFLNGGFVQILESKVLTALKVAQVPQSCIAEIQEIFDCIKDPFKGLKTEYKRIEHFKSNQYYIPPISFTISESCLKVFNTKDGQIVKNVKTTGQFIPFRYVLKNLFELPGALSATLGYIEFLNNVPADIICNVVQGKLWKKILVDFQKNDIVFPLDFYYDDVEPNADLGPHSEKLGAGYIMIPILPPACRSKLENIFLVLLSDADDRKSCTPGKSSYNAELFKPVVAEFNYLAKKGILCDTADLGERRIFFALNVVRGDNLGSHGLLGYAESFTANFPCLVCRAHKSCIHVMTKEDPNVLRDVNNYSEDVATNNVSLTGIKESCVFNQVKSYHVAQNYSQDIMHDGLEGVSHYILIPVLKHCIDSKFFTLPILNSRLFFFNFGPSDSANRPTPICDDFDKKSKLKGTAREISTLVRCLGVIIGDLVPENDPFWALYLLHKDILEICNAKEMPLLIADQLELKVHEHNSLYLKLVDRLLPPKFHYFLHSGRHIRNSGPLCHISCIRGESKHREVITKYAHAITSRRNLPLSVATKQQLSLCHRFLSKPPLIPSMECGPGEEIDIEDHILYADIKSKVPHCFKSKDTVQRVNWVKVNSTTYKPPMVLVLGVCNEVSFKFGKIADIFVMNGKPLFVCEGLKNMGYNDHVGGYEVIFCKSYSCVFHDDLYDPFPLFDFLMCTGSKYVVPKHYL